MKSGYTFRNAAELNEANKFWLQHPEMVEKPEPLRREVSFGFSLDNRVPWEDIFLECTSEDFEVNLCGHQDPILDISNEDPRILAFLEGSGILMVDESIEPDGSKLIN